MELDRQRVLKTWSNRGEGSITIRLEAGILGTWRISLAQKWRHEHHRFCLTFPAVIRFFCALNDVIFEKLLVFQL